MKKNSNFLKFISCICLLLIACFSSTLYSQLRDDLDTLEINISNLSSFSDGNRLPFWLYSNKENLPPITHYNTYFLTEFKNYNYNQHSFYLNYDLAVVAKFNNPGTKAYIHRAFLSTGYKFINLSFGIKPVLLGNPDKQLSTGGILFSGNNRPFPTLEIGLPEYITLPYTFNLIKIKGTFGNALLNDGPDVKNINLHYKSFNVELGGNFPININYGFIHAVQWGGNSNKYGQLPSGLKDYWDVFWGKSGSANSPAHEQLNALGNHLASQQLGITIKVNHFLLNSYVQTIHDDAPIAFLPTSPYITDKLLGIKLQQDFFKALKTILFEYLNTTDQSGPYHDKDGVIFGGNDNYFNNGVYTSGWSYYGFTIGNPLITSPKVSDSKTFLNNRVKVIHIALAGEIKTYSYKILGTFSENFGRYSNPTDIDQFSSLLELSKHYKSYNFSIAFTIDNGDLLGNSKGISIGIQKNFNIPLKSKVQ